MSLLRSCHLVVIMLVFASVPAAAQNDDEVTARTAGSRLAISGLAYLDYAYTIAAPGAGMDGMNGFTYRRLYLTTDYTLSDAFSGRARLEARDRTMLDNGVPVPFLKDLYLRWQKNGHRVDMGITSPPAFTVAEDVWGYRSLERTLMDRVGIVSSRDFGVAARGPIAAEGTVRYGVMVANNNSTRPENNKQKRVYGQLEVYPTDAVAFTIGADFADYDDQRDRAVTLNGFGGVTTDAYRAGIEGFYQQITLSDPEAGADARYGVSMFAAAGLGETTELVARYDRDMSDLGGVTTHTDFFLAGVAFKPHPQVWFIPNVLVDKLSIQDETFVTGRVTLRVAF